jgi:hypothetical protein
MEVFTCISVTGTAVVPTGGNPMRVAVCVCDPAKEQYWRELVAQWRSSGLSAREFCSLREVTEASFYSWRRELQRRDGQCYA